MFFQHFSSRKRVHLPKAMLGNGGNAWLLPRGGKWVVTFFKKKKKKVHCNINFRSDRGGFFPGIGSCKPLAARCDRPPGSWMRPKEFNAFYSATGRQATGHQGSSTESQHLCKGFQTMFQHPDTIPTPPLAEDSLA